MSQKKVDIYKEQKANRKQIIKKEKRMLMIEKTVACVVLAAIICWIGYSIYGRITRVNPEDVKVETTTLDTSALDEYAMNIEQEELAAEEEEAEPAEETTEEEPAEAETSDPAAESTDEKEASGTAEESKEESSSEEKQN